MRWASIRDKLEATLFCEVRGRGLAPDALLVSALVTREQRLERLISGDN